MRIAILQQSFGRFGGAERLALSHYVELKRQNADVDFFYHGSISNHWRDRLNGFSVGEIPTGFPRTPKEFRALIRFLKMLSGYDKILIHHHVFPLLASYISKLYGERTVWYSGSVFELAWEKYITGLDYRAISPTVRKTSADIHGKALSTLLLSDPFFDATVFLARSTDIETARGYSKVIANSQFLSRFLARVYRLPNVPPVVYPGPDPILEELSAHAVPEERDYMIVVGALIPLKNVSGIIRAAAQLESPTLMVVGDGQQRVELEQLATSENVSFEVHSGSPDETELARLYSQSRFLVQLSLYEPFGLTPVEAALFRKPSVVTQRGGPSETVLDGKTGYVVDPMDTEVVGSRMKQLLTDKHLAHEMGERARSRILEHFTLKRSAEALLAEVEQ
jgi:glycosyltransferase involved in cell wall biosynthesis